MIIVNRKFKFLRRRIREKFLKFHLDRNGDGLEAANAFSRCRRVDVGGDENPVVKAFKSKVDGDGVSLVDKGDAFAPTLGERLVEIAAELPSRCEGVRICGPSGAVAVAAGAQAQTAPETTTLDPVVVTCLLYTSPSPRDTERSRMPSSA